MSSTNPWIDMTAGVRRQTLVNGPTMLQMVVTFAPGARLPEHHHPHEQISHVLSGRLRFFLDGGRATQDVGAGESLYLAANRLHGAEALEAATVVDTFSPPREDLLAQDERAMQGEYGRA